MSIVAGRFEDGYGLLFIDWWQLGLFLFALSVIGGSVWAIWWTRRGRVIVRIAVAVLTTPLSGLAGILVLLAVVTNVYGCDSHGTPVYSPDGRIAARVETEDGGAMGGSSVVRLYTAHGFRTKTVFYGGWESVDDRDLVWQGHSELLIKYDHYQGYDEGSTCSGLGEVRVRCEAKPEAGQ